MGLAGTLQLLDPGGRFLLPHLRQALLERRHQVDHGSRLGCLDRRDLPPLEPGLDERFQIFLESVVETGRIEAYRPRPR